ncbi:50S ribosomal protein L11 methyltransferase [Candidatus Liberibacter sp.]|nr:50S ribosomal protein L11 methyltransferase [Candidatus Liberibacter sp.]
MRESLSRVLAIAFAKITKHLVLGVDKDPIAIRIVRENAIFKSGAI